jgi:hypothetical protein
LAPCQPNIDAGDRMPRPEFETGLDKSTVRRFNHIAIDCSLAANNNLLQGNA